MTEVTLGGLPLEGFRALILATFTFEDETDTYNFTLLVYYEGQLAFKLRKVMILAPLAFAGSVMSMIRPPQ